MLTPEEITETLKSAAADKQAAWDNAAAVEQAMAEVHARFRTEWLDATRRPDGSAGGVIPAHVLTCDMAAGSAKKRAESAKWSYQEAAGRISRWALGYKHARVCPSCEEQAVVLCMEAYYDVDRCCLCDWSETVHSLGD
jgi:hypothetical protein